MTARTAAVVLLLLSPLCALLACSEPRAGAIDPALLPVRSPFTVLVFFSPTCHCLRVHEPRLVALATRYAPRGVSFVVVDSEAGADESVDREEARRRGYPFPIVVDRGAVVADRLDATYASFSVLLDDRGRVLYRGGVDSDGNHLHDDAIPYLGDAIDDALARRAPRLAEAKTLGCWLRKR
jgi:hypothetical protein